MQLNYEEKMTKLKALSKEGTKSLQLELFLIETVKKVISDLNMSSSMKPCQEQIDGPQLRWLKEPGLCIIFLNTLMSVTIYTV